MEGVSHAGQSGQRKSVLIKKKKKQHNNKKSHTKIERMYEAERGRIKNWSVFHSNLWWGTDQSLESPSRREVSLLRRRDLF